MGTVRRADRMVSVIENAFVLAATRRLMRPADAPPLGTIRSLAYFLPVTEEISERPGWDRDATDRGGETDCGESGRKQGGPFPCREPADRSRGVYLPLPKNALEGFVEECAVSPNAPRSRPANEG
jgi:hypothetical protein